jgi:hypothetical protein
MAAPTPIESFKAYFDRDFEYGTDKKDVRDKDISKAIDQANLVFNAALWADSASAAIAFKFLTAHYLVKDIQMAGGLNAAAGQGINSTPSFPINSKSAGQLSVSYTLPAEMADSAVLSQYLTTGYGMKYLQLLMPNLIGNVANAAEMTKP